jgi:hypothetical protein
MATREQVTIFCQHLIWPLGCQEGRALAEALYGPEVVAAMDRDRYGNPAGFLHTYCRTKLHWISVSYEVGHGLWTAIPFPCPIPGRVQGDHAAISTLMRAEDALTRAPDDGQHWRNWFAEKLNMPTLRTWVFSGDGWRP